MSLTHKCPAGMIYDPKVGHCISIIKGESKAPSSRKNVYNIYGLKKKGKK